MLVRSAWNPDTYAYPPWLVANRKVSHTLHRFVPGGGNKVRGLPAVSCFPYLLAKPRVWVLFVVRAVSPGAAGKVLTVWAPPALDKTALRFALAHLRPLFGDPVYVDLPVTTSMDVLCRLLSCSLFWRRR